MVENMVSLKQTKADKKAQEKRYTIDDKTEQYPWGTRLELDAQTVAKLTGLHDIEGGDYVIVHAIAKVKSVNINDDDTDSKPSRRIELQLEKMSVTKQTDEDDFEDAFQESDANGE